MSTLSLLRLATRSTPNSFSCAATRRRLPVTSRSTSGAITSCAGCGSSFSTSSVRKSAGAHSEESYEEFNSRFEKEFDGVQDIFELQRNLNNAFAYDLVPNTSVIVAALKAARRVNDFPTAVRIFEGVKAKVENKNEYNMYLDELKAYREELGVPLKEEMYPEEGT